MWQQLAIPVEPFLVEAAKSLQNSSQPAAHASALLFVMAVTALFRLALLPQQRLQLHHPGPPNNAQKTSTSQPAVQELLSIHSEVYHTQVNAENLLTLPPSQP
jgi:hypothetical protein